PAGGPAGSLLGTGKSLPRFVRLGWGSGSLLVHPPAAGNRLMVPIAINARFYVHRPTGMQRYALELARRFGDRIHLLRPLHALRGAAGHLWEQLYLPSLLHGRLLWSPNNTGPLAVSRQVCTIHDLIPLDHPEWFNRRFAAWYEWLLPRLARKIQHII